jgi:putative flippase GtrA
VSSPSLVAPRAATVFRAGPAPSTEDERFTDPSPRTSHSRAPREFSTFVAVGAAATAVSASLYNLLAHTSVLDRAPLMHHPIIAFVLANIAGMSVSFIGTRWWVFRHRHVRGPAGGLVGFVVVNVASWIVPLACLSFSRYVLGLSSALADNLAVNVIGLGLGTVVRFYALRVSTFAG